MYGYHSTGIALPGLGGWIPLGAYLINNRHIRSARAAFRDVLVSKYVPQLSHIIGDTYRDVTLFISFGVILGRRFSLCGGLD